MPRSCRVTRYSAPTAEDPRPAAPTRRAALRRPPGPDAELGGINVARHVLRRGPHRTLPPRGAPHAPPAAADRPQLCGPSARPAPGRPGPAPPPPETTPARRCVSRWYAARDLSSSSSPAGPLPAMAATRRTAAACTSRTTIRTCRCPGESARPAARPRSWNLAGREPRQNMPPISTPAARGGYPGRVGSAPPPAASTVRSLTGPYQCAFLAGGGLTVVRARWEVGCGTARVTWTVEGRPELPTVRGTT